MPDTNNVDKNQITSGFTIAERIKGVAANFREFISTGEWPEELRDINEETLKSYSGATDGQLRDATARFRAHLASGGAVDDIIDEAGAVVYEAIRQVTGKELHKNQIQGGIVMAEGDLAEVKTGEGKTLMSILPTYLSALDGQGVHVHTANEYLAQRDFMENGPIYGKLGMTVGCITEELPWNGIGRKAAYDSDITYGTTKEFGFDYLRDNAAPSRDMQVMRGTHSAIVDEVDTLLDQSNTPLIMTDLDNWEDQRFVFGAAADFVKKYENFVYDAGDQAEYDVARGSFEEKKSLWSAQARRDNENLKKFSNYIQKNYVFVRNPATKQVDITDYGLRLAVQEIVRKETDIFDKYGVDAGPIFGHLVNSAHAGLCLQEGVDYQIEDGEVLLTSQVTGRGMKGQQLQDGLHQAVEAKEGLPITPIGDVTSSITIQSLLNKYSKFSGMSGTLLSAANEFAHFFGKRVRKIPRNVEPKIVEHADELYATKSAKYAAVVQQIEECQKTGQPILVGTESTLESKEISNWLKRIGIPHEVLNAENALLEAEIIAKAGQKGAVTITTDMAGRGTDIKLGGETKDGKVDKAAEQEVIKLGGLFVLGTAMHRARRIDDQLRGRAGRQGAPGATKLMVSLQDAFLARQPKLQRWAEENGLIGTDALIEDAKGINLVREAQKSAESDDFATRRFLEDLEIPISRQRDAYYDLREEILCNRVKSPEKRRLDKESRELKRQYRLAKGRQKKKIGLKFDQTELKRYILGDEVIDMKEVFAQATATRVGHVFDAMRLNEAQQVRPIENLGEIAEFVCEVFGGSVERTREFFKDTFGFDMPNLGDEMQAAKDAGRSLNIYGAGCDSIVEWTRPWLEYAGITDDNLGEVVTKWAERDYERNEAVYGKKATERKVAEVLLGDGVRSRGVLAEHWKKHLEYLSERRDMLWVHRFGQKDAATEFVAETDRYFDDVMLSVGNDLVKNYAKERTVEDIAFSISKLPSDKREAFDKEVARRRKAFDLGDVPREPINLAHIANTPSPAGQKPSLNKAI